MDGCDLAHGPNLLGLCHWCGAAPGDPWCSADCARAYAENHIWSAARRARLERDGGRCSICGTVAELRVHHDPPVTDYGRGCGHHQSNLRTLCHAHHVAVHNAMRAPEGTVTQIRLLVA